MIDNFLRLYYDLNHKTDYIKGYHMTSIKKISYFLLGAMVASVGYFIGLADRPVTAADDISKFQTIRTQKLIVEETIVISAEPDNPNGQKIYLSGKDMAIGLEQPVEGGKKTSTILLGIQDGNAVVTLQNRATTVNNAYMPKSNVILYAGKGANDIDHSFVTTKDPKKEYRMSSLDGVKRIKQ